MSRESIQSWAEATANRIPHPFYCTGPHRFGPGCYDCSGFTYMAYQSDGKIIPADSSLVARWGRDNGQVHAVTAAKLSDLLVHDRFGDPYNSTGPRGHIGLFVRLAGDRVVTYESASSGKGVGVYSRPISFWSISVQHPAFAGTAPAPPPPPPIQGDREVFRVIKGDKFEDRWLTNWLEKRHIGAHPGFDQAAKDERDAIIHAGVTDGAPEVTWPQVWVENIPTVNA